MAECDRRLEQYLQQQRTGAKVPVCRRRSGRSRLKKKKGIRRGSACAQDLFRMAGADLSQIDGIDVMTATTILSEAGWDMSKWKTEDTILFPQLRLCPDNRISGNKSHRERPACRPAIGSASRIEDGGQHFTD